MEDASCDAKLSTDPGLPNVAELLLGVMVATCPLASFPNQPLSDVLRPRELWTMLSHVDIAPSHA